jgi:TolB-like protein
LADEAAPGAPTVFVSYASEDREAARRIGAALPGYGLEVWYDESELGGGDAWDQKIRRQIRECDYFMALVSARTEARREGYFRREWRLAAERTLDMADDHPFLLPVTIDDTDATHARVPEKFQTVQWLKVPDGYPNPSLEALCRRLAVGGRSSSAPAPRASIHPGGSGAYAAAPPIAPPPPIAPTPPVPPIPPGKSSEPFTATPFPVHEAGQSVRFSFEVLGWVWRNGYQLFTRLPRWMRYAIVVWLVIALLSHGKSDRHADNDISPETEKKLDTIVSQYQKDPSTNLAKLGGLIAQQFGDSAQTNGASVLVLPFAGPAGDEAAAKLADSAFAQTYTRMSVARHSHLVAGDATTGCSLDALLAQGRAKHTEYVLCGVVDAGGPTQAMSVTLAEIKGAKVRWSNRYPVAGADPAKIALDVVAHVPEPEDDD